MSAVDIAVSRISSPTEEGFCEFPYDDATRLRVKAPRGNLTVAFGYNLDAGTSRELGQVILRWQLDQLDSKLSKYAWYATLDPWRQSVCLDIAFNQGLEGLLHYPRMIAALARGDWAVAALECSVSPDEPAGVIARYKRLADIIRTGADNA